MVAIVVSSKEYRIKSKELEQSKNPITMIAYDRIITNRKGDKLTLCLLLSGASYLEM